MNKKTGLTLVEVLIASTLFLLFLGGGFSLFFHGQNTITKSTWLNNSTRDEGLATRELSDLSKASSYPSKILKNNLIVNESDSYKAKIPQGVGNILLEKFPIDILAFPICTVQTDEKDANKKGKMKWIRLQLNNVNASKGRCNLNIVQSNTSSYTLSNNGKGSGLLNYTNNMAEFSSKTILRDIENAFVFKEASDSVRIDLVLSSAQYANFKKNVTLKFPLNVEFQ